LIVIDNGSTDGTREVIRQASLPNMTVEYVHDGKPGKSAALNRALPAAKGEILMFTDDDLRFSPSWIVGMTAPFLNGKADGVAGAVKLAPHLSRPWMHQVHRNCLAETDPSTKPGPTGHMIGANMGFRRSVLSKVPGFDPELGPGGLGFGDDSLLSYQLTQAGYALEAIDESVEHHPQLSRLTREYFLGHSKKLGMTGAYLDHHWEHKVIRTPKLQLLRKTIQLALWRKTHPADVAQSEGMALGEMHHLRSFHLYGHYLVERLRPRNYEWHGLVRLGSSEDAS
jgi:glycosyltransferase involved in cell wall biosynthesis